MDIKKIGSFLGLSFVLIIVFFAYVGAFHSVTVEKKNAGPFHVAYHKHTGSYKEFTNIIKNVRAILEEAGVEKYNPMGIYFDDPGKVAEANLRSYVGAVIEESELAKLLPAVQKGHVHYKKIDAREYAVTVFPYKNFVSIFLGIAKVYPALNEYANQNGFPEYTYKEKEYEGNYIMEVYEPEAIHYYMTTP